MGQGCWTPPRFRLRQLLLTPLLAVLACLPSQPIESSGAARGHVQTVPARCGAPDEPGGCFTYFPLVMRPTFAQVGLPIGLNSGGWEFQLDDGRRFLSDQAHNPSNGAGYEGGEAITSDDSLWEPIDGTHDDNLYRTGRSGLAAYRFNVPNGHYVVELHIAEIRHHGPWFRMFDVAIEGQPVLRSLDLYRLAQHDYAVRYRFAAEVLDRQLDVTFAGAIGAPMVSAIWVDQRMPDSLAPASPAGVQVAGGYGRAIVRWRHGSEDDIAGYRVFRAESVTGPFQVLAQELTPLARYFDDAVTAGTGYCYRVVAVDVYGNESQPSAPTCATVIDHAASSLPVLDLIISPANLYALAANPFVDVEVPGILAMDGQHFAVVAQYRGRYTRGSNKKGWKLVADRPMPPWQQSTLLLNGEGYDAAMIREKLSYDLFEVAGVQATQARFVHLTLNGEFIGVYTQIENPDAEFLRRTGRNVYGDVFKCMDGLDLQPECANQVVAGRGLTSLYNFAAIVNRTPEVEFASAIADVLDVREFLTYQALKAVTADPDSAHQYLLYHDPQTQRWQVLPWDNNITFNRAELPIDYGTVDNPGWGIQVNMLLNRVLQVPQFRRHYGQQLLELAQGPFSLASMNTRFAATKQEIWFDAQRDVYKAFREENELVATHISYLTDFVSRRIDYLRLSAPAYMPATDRFIGLNELMVSNLSTILDPVDGQAEPWFEITNAGLLPVDIGGMYLTDSLAAPTRYRIPAPTTLPALGSLLFWADEEAQQGANHVNFALSPLGGRLYLIERNGATVVDVVDYPSLPADISFARFPDYNGEWLAFTRPTPSQPNRLHPPEIWDVAQTPLFPRASDMVTVTALIVDDGAVSQAHLIVNAGGPVLRMAMFDDGSHGDGDANDGRYGAQIPAMAHGTTIKYYLEATDDYNRVTFDPFAAPVLSHSYRIGYQPPSIAISEFMAANTATLEDPDEPGDYPDWIELVNTGTTIVSLSGYYLTDNLEQPSKFRIPAGVTVPPGGNLLFWADDDPEQGPLHTNFKLSKKGEIVALFDRDGATPIEVVTFPAQPDDVSYGRCQLGANRWQYLYLPTPGSPNACSQQRLPMVLCQ